MARLPIVPAQARQNRPSVGGAPLTAFGAGVAQGLSTLASQTNRLLSSKLTVADAENVLSEAYRARQESQELSQALIDTVRFKSDLDKEFAFGVREAQPDATGFEETFHDFVTKRKEEFLSGLSPKTRERIAPRVEEIAANATKNALLFRLGAEEKHFVTTFGEVVQDAVDGILEDRPGENRMEFWLDMLEPMLESSTVSPMIKEELSKEMYRRLEEAELSQRKLVESSQPWEGRGTIPSINFTDRRPVAAGLTAAQAGFLEALATGEGALDYNSLFSDRPDRRVKFTGFSNHPQKFIDGHSNAGLYQITAATWETIKKNTGLTDFRPEFQDRGTLWYANFMYNKITGRDFLADLETGDPVQLAKIYDALKQITWTGLQRITLNDFVKIVTGGEASPSLLAEDPRYSDLTFREREAIILDTDKKLATIRAKQLAVSAEEHQRFLANLNRGVVEGVVGDADLLKSYRDGDLSITEYEKLLGRVEKYQEDRLAVRRFVNAVFEEGRRLDYTNPEDQAAASAWYKIEGQDAVNNLDGDFVKNQLIPVVLATGIVPRQAVLDLTAFARSSDIDRAVFAYQTLESLFAPNDGTAQRNFSKEQGIVQEVMLYSQLSKTRSPEAAIEALRARTSPMTENARSLVNQQIQQYQATNPELFSVKEILKRLDMDVGVFGGDASAVLSSLLVLYEDNYITTNDHEASYKAAIETLRNQIGATSIGGVEQATVLPPEILVSNLGIEGDFSWMDAQARKEFLIPEGQKYIFQTDGQTSDGRPSWAITFVNEDGSIKGWLRDSEGKPARYTPELSEYMLQQSAPIFQRRKKVRELQREIKFLRTELNSVRPVYSGVPGDTGEPPVKGPYEIGLEKKIAAAEAEIKLLQSAGASIRDIGLIPVKPPLPDKGPR